MQTSYVVSGPFTHKIFDKKEDAEKHLGNMIYDAVCDFKFSVDVLQSFHKHYSNIELFEKKVEKLIELATEENVTKELLEIWNEVFPDDQLALVEITTMT
jgi:hypothetical protein